MFICFRLNSKLLLGNYGNIIIQIIIPRVHFSGIRHSDIWSFCMFWAILMCTSPNDVDFCQNTYILVFAHRCVTMVPASMHHLCHFVMFRMCVCEEFVKYFSINGLKGCLEKPHQFRFQV